MCMNYELWVFLNGLVIILACSNDHCICVVKNRIDKDEAGH